MNEKKGRAIALLPIGVFLVLYLGLGIIFEYVMKIPMGFYNVPIIVAFLAAILVACIQNRELVFDERKAISIGVYHYFFKLADSHAVIQPVDKDDFQFVEVTLTRKGCDLCNVLSFTVHSLFCFRCLGGYDSASEEDTE